MLLSLLLVGLLPSAADAVGVQTFAIPSPDAGATDIAAGPDGNLWFTERRTYKIGRITPAGQISEFGAPSAGPSQDDTGPDEIVAGADGALYALSDVGETTLRITPDGVARVIEYDLIDNARHLSPFPGGGAWEVLAGSDDGGIRTVAPDGQVRYAAVDLAGGFAPIATAPDGAAWYADGRSAIKRIGVDGVQRTVPLPASIGTNDVSSIAFARDGSPWFTGYFQIRLYQYSSGGVIGHVNADGTATVVSLGGDYLPFDLTAGPDGALWWIEKNGLGRLDPATGTVAHASLGAYQPTGMTFGADGALWFVDQTANQVGRIALAAAFPAAAIAGRRPTAPAVRLSLPHQRRTSVVRRRALSAACRLAGPGTCTVEATVAASTARRLGLRVPRGASRVRLARGSVKLARPGTAQVRLRLSARAVRALRRTRRATVTLAATATAPGATSRRTTRAIVLR